MRERSFPEETVYTYCLYCESVKCSFVAAAAQTILLCRAIRPRQVQHRLKDGRADDAVRDLMPGYVFLYFEEDPFPAVLRMRTIPGVRRIVGDSGRNYALTGDDEQFALGLLSAGGVVGKMQVYEEGTTLHLMTSGRQKIATEILKVDRRKQRMKIQLNFSHQPTTTWVEYEIMEKPLQDADT